MNLNWGEGGHYLEYAGSPYAGVHYLHDRFWHEVEPNTSWSIGESPLLLPTFLFVVEVRTRSGEVQEDSWEELPPAKPKNSLKIQLPPQETEPTPLFCSRTSFSSPCASSSTYLFCQNSSGSPALEEFLYPSVTPPFFVRTSSSEMRVAGEAKN
ncbi:hypothetical protein VNO77_02370 [Canavalia gladiata]|uniref:Uncharacterized protein n=1 Tax=Canavalia gladiata TaxID=3824 RepID=A0AAN9R622_CANGL